MNSFFTRAGTIVTIAVGVYALPLIARTAPPIPGPTGGETSRIVGRIGVIVRDLIPIVVGIALLVFVWGLVKFIWKAGSDDGRKEGKQIMLWGIIALFVIVSIWGIVRFIGDELLGSYSREGGGVPPPFIQGI